MSDKFSRFITKKVSPRALRARKLPLTLLLLGSLTPLACKPESSKGEKSPPAAAAATAASAAPAKSGVMTPPPTQPVQAATVYSVRLEDAQASVFALQEVNDVEAHRTIFRANDAVRQKAGVVQHLLSRDVDNPKKFIVHYAAKSEKEVRDFLSSDAYQKYQTEDQVTNSNLVLFATNELIYVAESLPVESFSLFKKFPTKDINSFTKIIKDNIDTLKASGLFLISVHRSSSDKNIAIVHLAAETKDTLVKTYAGKVFSDARTASGATNWDAPRIFKDER